MLRRCDVASNIKQAKIAQREKQSKVAGWLGAGAALGMGAGAAFLQRGRGMCLDVLLGCSFPRTEA